MQDGAGVAAGEVGEGVGVGGVGGGVEGCVGGVGCCEGLVCGGGGGRVGHLKNFVVCLDVLVLFEMRI